MFKVDEFFKSIVIDCEDTQEEMKTDSVHIRENATGHMLCWGSGEFGQHGHGNKKEVHFLDGAVEMFCSQFEHRVKHVGCGASHTAVVTNDNDLYLWGNGNNGQLGTSDLSTKMEPHKLAVIESGDQSSIAGVACGGRHTVVWLENGNVYSFGNNFHAQLGYDYRQKNSKEAQPKPVLLKCLVHKKVVQVACGDKHTMFRFQDGDISCVGNNFHGQIGTGDRKDALTPTSIDVFNEPVTFIAAGSKHSLAVTESGNLFAWGYSKACGSKTDDILEPLKFVTHKTNVIMAAGGSTHSMALTANGSVYTWGSGHDGQLGHGENIKFLNSPRRVKDRHVICKCVQISCGETFSAAITEKGLLYMWGKNSHTIMPNKPTSHKIFLPYGVNKNFRGGRLSKIYCGFWHAVAVIGRPQLLLRQESQSEDSGEEQILRTDNNIDDDDEDSDLDIDIPSPTIHRQPTKITNMEREKTTVSIADFYAPTPDINETYRSPSPEFYFPNDGDETDRNNLNSTRSAATLIVQLPVQPMTSFADAATSPMTLTTTSSSKSSSITTLSRVPSPIGELAYRKHEKVSRRKARPEKKFKEFDPQKYEREKLRSSTTPVSEVVQLSRTPADAFILPREPTGLSKKHVDFAEMEEIRLRGPRSPEKLSRLSRYKENRDSSPTKFRVTSPDKYRDTVASRSRHRYVDSSLSIKSDSAILMESPLFKGSRKHVVTEMGHRTPLETVYGDERQYKHHVPKQQPRKYIKPQLSESNFGLQISRSQTIIAPVQMDSNDPSDRLSQLRRYAAIHNPQASGKSPEKLRPIKNRHVSIPGIRSDSPDEDRDQLCIGGVLNPKEKPVFSSGSTWKDRGDLERLAPRKLAGAGIVKMHIGNHELVGTVSNQPMYTAMSDGRGHSDPLTDGDTLIVQPLLKKSKRGSGDTVSMELPSIAITRSVDKQATANIYSGTDEMDNTLNETQGADKMIYTGVS
ncbi:Ultraviolet-B receptor uvr8 [Mactra antiquata]